MDHNPCGNQQQYPTTEATDQHPLHTLIDFVAHLSPSETPLTSSLLGPPRPIYCLQTVREPRFPEHSIWAKAKELLQKVTPDEDDYEEYWVPSQSWYDLDHIVRELYRIAFNVIPNPEYDALRCELWEAEHPGRKPIDQKKVEWGISKMVDTRELEGINGTDTDDSTS